MVKALSPEKAEELSQLTDEELMNKYLESGVLSEDEITAGIRQRTIAGEAAGYIPLNASELAEERARLDR